MGRKLTNQEIRKQLQEGRNYKHLYYALKAKYDRVTTELRTENKQLRAEIEQLKQVNATLRIQIAELQTMVFGKRRKPPWPGTSDPDQPTPPAMSQSRTKDSYRREIPPATAITAEVPVSLPRRCRCGGRVSWHSITKHVRYEEDIPLPELTPRYQPHLVTKYIIERGVCRACGKVTSGCDIGGATVTLGPNVRLLVTHLVAGVGLSYAQVTSLILSLYELTVTDGEIASILQKQHRAWLPAYGQLRTDIRAAPVVHGDETPWPIQSLQGAGYAWSVCDSANAKVCFALERSRGAAYAKALFGQGSNQPFAGIRVSDDYGPYRNTTLPGRQQLCWVHLYRAIRDLRHNTNVPQKQLLYVARWYERFATIYQTLRQNLQQPYDAVVRRRQSDALWRRLQTLAVQPAPKTGEPQKLTRLKAQLLRAGQDRLLVCLTENTPCDNNRAERELRQLVLKRKRSFGSKTEKGATALATLLSLCTTTWRTSPQHYFKRLAGLSRV